MPLPYKTQAVIGYDNVFTLGTLSSNSSPAGGEAANAVDGFTWDYWRPTDVDANVLTVDLGTAQSVDYFAFHATNLEAIGGTIRLERSDDGSTFVNVSGPHAPVKGRPFMALFNTVSARYYRVALIGTGAILGVVQAGQRLTLPEGVFVGESPASLNPDTEILNSNSEGGQFLGRSLIRKGAGDVIKQDRVTQSWARNEWQAFSDHAQLKPFFYGWRTVDRPLETMYAWSRGDAKVAQGANGFMSVELSIEGQA